MAAASPNIPLLTPMIEFGIETFKKAGDEIMRPAREKAKKESEEQVAAVNQQIAELDKRKETETAQAAQAARSAQIRSRNRYDLPSPTTFTSSLGSPASGKKLLGV